MTATGVQTAAERYAARVDAVLEQRTRLRGPEPPGDLFSGLPADHPLLVSNPRRPLEANWEAIASYLAPDDVIVDAGGGAGRVSLPLALHCREVINVDASAAMGAGFAANASRAEITNVRFIQGEWLSVDPPIGTFALVNHVTYFARDIRPFIERLERAGRRRVVITVNSTPPPSWNRVLFELVYGEPEAIVPGHAELVDVLWELGILPDVRMLSQPPNRAAIVPAATREQAISGATTRFGTEQWALWPMEPVLEGRLKETLESRFEQLFDSAAEGYVPKWVTLGREVLITWEPSGA